MIRILKQLPSLTLACGLGVPLIASATLVDSPHIRIVAEIGDPAPGADADFRRFFNAPSINAAGQVLFYGGLSLSGSQGIWRYDPGEGVVPVAVRGQSAPGMGANVEFESFDSNGNGGNNRSSVIPFNESGRTAFRATTTAGDGFWVADPAGMTLVARSGEIAEGTSDPFAQLGARVASVSDAGHVAFYSRVQIGVDREAVIHRYDDLNGLSLVTRDGGPVAGSVPNQHVRQPGFEGVLVDNRGRVHFKTSLTESTSSFAPRGVGVGVPGQLPRMFYANGDHAVGLHEEAQFSSIFPFETAANGRGQIAFTSGIFDPLVNDPLDVGVWAGPSDALELVIRKGDPVVEIPGAQVKSLANPEINARGRVAVRGFLEGPLVDASNDEALWLQDGSGRLELIAREGDAPPGAPPGVTFGNSFSFSVFSDIVLNDRGQIAFRGSVIGQPTPGNTNMHGIWATDIRGDMQLIVLAGPEFETLDRGTRSIGTLEIAGGTGGDEGYGAGLSNGGHVAFFGSGQYGTAIYVSSRVVPEPSCGAIMVLAVTMLCGTGRSAGI